MTEAKCPKCREWSSVMKYRRSQPDWWWVGALSGVMACPKCGEWSSPGLTRDVQEVEFWDCDKDAERLSHESIDEALESFLDVCPLNKWQDVTVVNGFVRRTIEPGFRPVVERKVHTMDWVRENRPHWLPDLQPFTREERSVMLDLLDELAASKDDDDDDDPEPVI